MWALGVILSNLVTGRNPWKKASIDDPTFAAFLRDSEFLKSILPFTDEMDWIMRRIFECDPSQRVTISQLRRMIIRCPAFTTSTPSVQAQDECTMCIDEGSVSSPDVEFDESDGTYSPSYSTYSGSSGSDENWASAPHSPYYMPPLRSNLWPPESFEELAPLPPPEQQHLPRVHQVSPPPNAWYSPFVPALDFTQKHMSIQPLLPGMRLF